ncbi:MAG: hypothetical protein AB7V56_05815 [Candidatus Nitrosocosmicus sp.]|uniref:hypothetical protein n=1 Tax=Candidatus Nitrosocosmicus agrestis TaxID=2563600 RepID=UPI00122E7921|nr:hypothetical protein [Candidatus Nitrosocosmicus sp. SS]KAA2283424.1 hypothetical protein F1Z66_02705 [Candidatus Nitrosocosmicus sp. SS]KAF0868929.1 hypothetical protein E5N71_08020 [Candidatus Nitrosocosmicus sp. SS]MDR4492091.1 hypothetical protein [Candidatus Nitrosocosmicus sp.]HET6588534.1 hypothetical protein [Candidatus Nitrosocosmicus sp.]
MLENYYIIIAFCICIYLLAFIYNARSAYAQWILQPLPLPGPPTQDCCYSNVKNDTTPPKITITSNLLYEGNNVLKLKIEDESPLKIRGINFTQGNKSIETYLAKEQNQEYIALVKAIPPFTEVQVKAVDVNDNAARVVQQIKVENWFDMVMSSITNNPFWKNAASLFGVKN